eukprot:306868-Prymnesium_polylepis.1
MRARGSGASPPPREPREHSSHVAQSGSVRMGGGWALLSPGKNCLATSKCLVVQKGPKAAKREFLAPRSHR